VLPNEVVEEDSAYLQKFPKLSSGPKETPKVVKMKRRPGFRNQEASPPEAATFYPEGLRVKWSQSY